MASASVANGTVSEYFACIVQNIFKRTCRVVQKSYDDHSDICTLLMSTPRCDVATELKNIKSQIRASTQVDEVSMYIKDNGQLSIVLKGCQSAFERWAKSNFRLYSIKNFVYFIYALVIAVSVLCFYLWYR